MSNRPHNRPQGPPEGPDGPGVPPELQHAADVMNAWHAAFLTLRPGAVSFRVDVVDVTRAGKNEAGVQLWAMRPSGTSVDTIPPQLARELAALLVEKADQADSGITVVRAPLHTTNGSKTHA